MARASNSLPTPDSPSISTGMLLAAAFLPNAIVRVMASDLVMMWAKEKLPSRRARSALRLDSRVPSFKALRREMVMRSGATGLTKKSTAPNRMAEMTVSSEVWAVWTMTGMAMVSRRSASRTAMPSISGMTISRIMAPMPGFVRNRSRAFAPESAVSAVNPALATTSEVRRD